MKKLPHIALLALFLTACGQQTPETADKAAAAPAALGSADGVAGKIIAEATCTNCHGTDGMSRGPDIPNLAGQKAAYLSAALTEYKTGGRDHVALKQLSATLSDQDILNVSAYFAGLNPVDGTAPTAAAAGNRIAAGKKAAEACVSCHGTNGNTKTKDTPNLTAQHPGYLSLAMHAYADGTRKDSHMTTRTSELNQSAIENIAIYFSAQTPAAPVASKLAAKGEPLTGKCGGCHGQKGHSADTKTPSLAGQNASYLVKTLKEYRDGGRPHAEMKTQLTGIKDADIEQIAAFYAAQKPQQVKLTTPTSGQAWADRCDKCHGPTANNPAMIVPSIESQPVNYLANSLKAYRDAKRPQSTMHTMGEPLTDADIDAIAQYYSALPRR